MDTMKRFTLFFILIGGVEYVFMDLGDQYEGQDFPAHYLNPDGQTPSDADLELYIDRAFRITNYFSQDVNNTEANQAVASFLGTAILKRTLQDYGHKLPRHQAYIKALANNMANLVSHFVYRQMRDQLGFKIAKIMRDFSPNAHALGTFKNGVLKKWLLQYAPVNDFLAAMDQLTLRKEEYAALVDSIDDLYSITGVDSDHCLARLAYNMDPVNVTTLQPCRIDYFCRERMFVSPSVAYTLSHRVLNSMMYVHNRRCYHYSPEFDNRHIEMLCAHMYREMVYIARKGYFARDMFMEHLALCAQMGYEEFHRRHWFHKIANWIDGNGCMQEFGNFEINRTALILATVTSRKEVRRIKKHLDELLYDDCQHHPMSVALLALTTGIRHAAHFIDDSIVDA